MRQIDPKAVIFDLGSTLIEYEGIPWPKLGQECNAAGWRFLKDQRYQVPDEEEFDRLFDEIYQDYRMMAHDTMKEWTVMQIATKLFAKLKLPADTGLVERYFEAYYEPVAKELYVYEDTRETLERVKARYGVIGLISNTVFPEEAHREELKRFDLADFLNFALFSSTFGMRKPHPDIFYKAANLAGYAPSECVYIGDRYLEDFEGPTEIGMPAILKLVDNREYPENMGADVPTIKTLSELEFHLDI